MKIIIGSTEFDGEGYFEAENTIYMSMRNNNMTIPELEWVVLNNEKIEIINDNDMHFTYVGYNSLDAISYTYNTPLNNGTKATLLNIQIKKG